MLNKDMPQNKLDSSMIPIFYIVVMVGFVISYFHAHIDLDFAYIIHAVLAAFSIAGCLLKKKPMELISNGLSVCLAMFGISAINLLSNQYGKPSLNENNATLLLFIVLVLSARNLALYYENAKKKDLKELIIPCCYLIICVFLPRVYKIGSILELCFIDALMLLFLIGLHMNLSNKFIAEIRIVFITLISLFVIPADIYLNGASIGSMQGYILLIYAYVFSIYRYINLELILREKHRE